MTSLLPVLPMQTRSIHSSRFREDGFTLIEIMVVILIMGIIAAYAVNSIPKIKQYQLDRTVEQTVSRVQLKLDHEDDVLDREKVLVSGDASSYADAVAGDIQVSIVARGANANGFDVMGDYVITAWTNDGSYLYETPFVYNSWERPVS